MYETLCSAGDKVKTTADAETQRHIVNELADIERLRLDTDLELAERLQQLELTSSLWEALDAGMESILQHLKKTSASLTHPLSDNYDDLEQELQRCQVCTERSVTWCTFFCRENDK